MTRPLPTHLLKARMWNAGRDALLRSLISGGTPPSKCVAPVAALDGAPIAHKRQIAARMIVLGIRLSDEHLRAALRAASTGRANGKGAAPRMTPERLAYLREAYARGEDDAAIWPVLSAMPGAPISSPRAIAAHAKKHRIKRPRAARPVDMAKLKAAKVSYERARRARKRADAPARRLQVAPAPAPVLDDAAEHIEPSPAIADAVTEARYAKVKAALSKRNADTAALARVHGMPLREVYRLAGELRREMRA